MLPYFDADYGNAGSTTHSFGYRGRDAVEDARQSIRHAIGATSGRLIFTSGATESNNLALLGLAQQKRLRGKHIVSVATEHKAVLDPLGWLGQQGFEVTLLSVEQQGSPRAGLISVDQLEQALRPETAIVSVMLANNEIGVLQPIAEIGRICRARGVHLHCDATQAVGKLPVDVESLGVDLMGFSAHKLYGPKGVGALYVRQRTRIEPRIFGGGQEFGLRSGTLNVPGIVGFAKAIELAIAELPREAHRLAALRRRLHDRLVTEVPDALLNGPALDAEGLRLPGNLNLAFPQVDGEALIMSIGDLAVSSGSACTSANPEPSHVLRALGLQDDLVRTSLRFGLGRFNTEEEVDFAAKAVGGAVRQLRQLATP